MADNLLSSISTNLLSGNFLGAGLSAVGAAFDSFLGGKKKEIEALKKNLDNAHESQKITRSQYNKVLADLSVYNDVISQYLHSLNTTGSSATKWGITPEQAIKEFPLMPSSLAAFSGGSSQSLYNSDKILDPSDSRTLSGDPSRDKWYGENDPGSPSSDKWTKGAGDAGADAANKWKKAQEDNSLMTVLVILLVAWLVSK